jgi:hypothetical protein
MIIRLFLAFIAIILGAVSVFGADSFILFKPFVNLFGESGIQSVLGNKYVVFSLIYLAYFIGFFNILKIALKPVFGSEHNKEANTIALMLSFIGITGMFFMFSKEGGIESAILLFGGSIGFLLLVLVCLSILIGLYRSLESKLKWVWIFLTLTFIFICLQMYVLKMIEAGVSGNTWNGVYEGLAAFSAWTMVITLILGIKAFVIYRKENKFDDVESIVEEKNPELENAKDSISKIQNNLKTINNSVNNIKRGLE